MLTRQAEVSWTDPNIRGLKKKKSPVVLCDKALNIPIFVVEVARGDVSRGRS